MQGVCEGQTISVSSAFYSQVYYYLCIQLSTVNNNEFPIRSRY